jgi:uncharacterized cupin superfamily protein
MKEREIEGCHGGAGRLVCTELLADYQRSGPGLKYVHDDVVEVGATIGEHAHSGDEEAYLILEGTGTMIVDGARHAVGPGDLVLTRDGHSHGLENGPDGPMRLLVVCAGL